MILANGLYGHSGRTPKPDRPKVPTPAQRRSVESWLTRRLADVHINELRTALRLASSHPDAHSTGYSRAKSARERLEAELATRP